MRTASALVIACVGCAHPAPPPAVTNQAPITAAAYEPVLERGCEAGKPVPFGPGVTVAVATCTVEVKPEPPPSTLSTTDRKAQLVLHGQRPEPFDLGTWNDGWEWGGSWDIVGVLSQPNGNAVLVMASGYSEDTHHSILHAYAIAGGAWHEVAAAISADDIRVDVAADGHGATVSYCNGDNGGHVCRDTPGELHVANLAWDGRAVVQK